MIKQSILKTLHYFDITKFPLTKEEIFSWLWQCPNVSREQLEWELQILNEEKKIGEKYGYYFLYGGEDAVEWRRERLLSSEDKMKIALKAAKKINFIPFLRAIFVCNTVGSEQSTENSDIDFLIKFKGKKSLFDLSGLKIELEEKLNKKIHLVTY